MIRAISLKNLAEICAVLLVVAGIGLTGSSSARAATTIFYDFNTVGQLTSAFNSHVSSGSVSQANTGGISNSGAINAPGSANAVFATKSTYSLGPQGSTYTFNAFLQSVGNSGYSGMGFTSLLPGAANASTIGFVYRPNDALGVSVHGGGYVFHWGSCTYGGQWNSNTDANVNSGDCAATLNTVTPASINDLLNSGSNDKWYKLVLIIERTANNTFKLRVEVWPSSSTGNLLNGSASAVIELTGVKNATISGANSISSYVNFSGDRVRYFDNYRVDLEGSTEIQAGAPVVLTSSFSEASGVITVGGNVTSDGGADVTDRGFVYGTSANPTTSSNKVSVGTGTGTFSGNTGTLSSGTYYVRAFATNSTGTSYGAESTVVVTAPDTTAPTLSSSTPANGAAFFSNSGNLSFTFSESVVAGTGNINIVETANPGTPISIDITSNQVSISGNTVTVNPSADLDLNTNYHVLIDAGAVRDAAGNNFAGIALDSTLAFTTSKVPTNGLTVALDASIASSYSGSGTTWTDLSGAGNNLALSANLTLENNPKAVRFTASSSQYGQFSPDNLLNRSEYTKLVWFKPTSFTNLNNLFSSNTTAAHAFWGGGNKDACTGAGDNLASGHNDQWWTVQSEECMETEWQLAAVTFDSDAASTVAGWKLYRNGSLVGQSSDRTAISDANLGYKTRIASYGTGNFFDGQISQVYLFNRALEPTEIDAIFEATAPYFGLDLKTVTFNPGGGSVFPASLKTQAGTGTVTLPLPTKANSAFQGWFTQQTGGTRVGGAGDSFTPSASTTVYAQWVSSFTVTFSPGTNASVSPTTANFLGNGSAITLPTPTRADFVFDGWYTASSGGTKVGNGGASYTPTADVTLHGRWVQASLAGIDPADLVEVNSTTIQNGVSSTNTHTIGSSSVSLSIPSGALSAGVVVKLYSVANHNRAQTLLPNESDFVNSMVVSWLAPDSTVPTASTAITLTITDANIRSGAKIYSIVGDQATLIATASQNGSVTISITTDPLITIANPVVSQNSGSGGGGGGGGAQQAPAPISQTPEVDQTVKPRITAGQAGKVDFSIKNSSLVTAVKLGSSELKFTTSADQKLTVELPKLRPGKYTLDFLYPGGQQQIDITVAVPQKVVAGTFSGVAAVYVSGYLGQRVSVRFGRQWVVIPSVGSDFTRITRPLSARVPVRVLIYVDRKLVETRVISPS